MASYPASEGREPDKRLSSLAGGGDTGADELDGVAGESSLTTGDSGGHNVLDDHKVVMEALRGLAAQEYDRGERFGSRARQAFLFAAGFFAVVQTVAFSSFEADLVNDAERRALLTMAIVAGASLAICGISLLVSDGIWKARDLDAHEVLRTANQAAHNEEPVAVEFASLYARVLVERQSANGKRRRALRVTQTTALITALAIVLELIYALNARI
ncbi:MAG: hypothetical protein M3389_05755 [Actinomycetota bacterium]|nr:hypothetical protein [Actinomycetota bacterium]